MSTVKDFALPDLGEGLTESDLVAWRVAVGDTVELNQIIAEVETAKALVEVPSPFAGTVSRLYVEPGSTVRVGAPIVAFELEDTAGAQSSESAPAERQSVLVGRGPEPESGARPRRRARGGAATAPADVSAPEAPAPEPSAPAERPRSTPPVRALARERGVDLTTITGTGPDGLIVRTDVLAAAGSGGVEQAPADQAPAEPVSAVGGRASRPRETRIPIAGVRKRTAEAMVASAFGAPQVTEFLTVDVTPSLELIASLSSSREFREHRLTLLGVVAKAFLIALARTPQANARWDADAGEIVGYGYVNLGIAVAGERGLTVPNLKDADRLSFAEIADGIADLAARARAGRSTPAELTGGTASITNVGVFGVDAGTPILNPPEAVILAMGAVRRQPWEYRGEVALRQVMTLALTFDHRLVDGEQGSKVLRDTGAVLADPGLALAMA